MIGKCVECVESGDVGRTGRESGLLLQSAHVSLLLLGRGRTAFQILLSHRLSPASPIRWGISSLTMVAGTSATD